MELMELVAPLGDTQVEWRFIGRFCGLGDAGSGDHRQIPDS